ncbi:MAG: hypothetical protein ABIM98_07495 [candidate division WOR-3 bacterium]
MKLGPGMLKEKLKGRDKFETAENCSILGIIIGLTLISSGFLVSMLNPKGLAAILLMIGSFIIFLSTVALVLTWIFKEILG